MNILYLNHNIIWESTFHRCFRFAKELVKRGHNVTLVTNDNRSRLRFKNKLINEVKVVKTPDLFWGQMRTGWDLINALRRTIYLGNKKYDLIHAFDTRPTVILPALYLKNKYNIPLVIDWGDWWGRGGAIRLRQPLWLNKVFEPMETFFEEYFRRFADFTTVVSPELKSRAEKLLRQKAKIEILANGADLDLIKTMNQDKARGKLGLQNEKCLALFAGFVIYDIEMILDAIRLLNQQRFPIKLIVTGASTKLLKSLGKDLLNSGKLILTGKIETDQLKYWFNSANVGLMPLKNNIANKSRHPMKLGDYLAAGLPVVTNEVGEAGKLIAKNKLGLVCKYDATSYADSIKRLLRNKKRYQKIQENCIKFVKGRYNFKKRTQELEKIYKKITNENK